VEIVVKNISKQYEHILFENLSFFIQKNEPIAVLGKNGSGKSTLLKIIAGILQADTGCITYYSKTMHLIKPDELYRHISFLSSYSELIEEFTLLQQLQFHQKFINPLPILNLDKIIGLMHFENFKNTLISKFSSGMKQKLKIALSLFYQRDILIFDEPCVNLDTQTIDWYNDMITEFTKERILVIGSNNPSEYAYCKKKIQLDKAIK